MTKIKIIENKIEKYCKKKIAWNVNMASLRFKNDAKVIHI